jgi:hypothetical protein
LPPSVSTERRTPRQLVPLRAGGGGGRERQREKRASCQATPPGWPPAFSSVCYSHGGGRAWPTAR